MGVGEGVFEVSLVVAVDLAGVGVVGVFVAAGLLVGVVVVGVAAVEVAADEEDEYYGGDAAEDKRYDLGAGGSGQCEVRREGVSARLGVV